LVAAISDFLFRHQANILHADEHSDEETGLFLMRVEFDASEMNISLAEMRERFAPVGQKFNMRWKLADHSVRPRMGILVSQYPHCLADLLYRHENGELHCDIPLVISNHLDTQRLAAFYGVPFVHLPVNRENKTEVEKKQISLLREHGCDLIVLARYMQILSPEFVADLERVVHSRAVGWHLENRVLLYGGKTVVFD
jgi:formyltetrahydrofolate deformylase